jgi:hydrogenase/urease accessory protein HupE
MANFLLQFAARLALMVPVVMIAAALLWYGVRAFGAKGAQQSFNLRDMRTWPLKFALADAALFGATFALVAALLPESDWAVAIGGGVAALVAIAIGPWLLARFAR